MKNYLISLFILFSITVSLSGYQTKSDTGIVKKKQLLVGEEIVYKVKYLFFELGEVRLKITDASVQNRDTIYKAAAYIDSYEGVPFVTLHQIYESSFNQNQIPVMFRGTVLGEKDTSVTQYTFKKNENLVHIYRGRLYPEEKWVDSTVVLNEDHQDGLSIFYFARMRTGEENKMNVPCFVNEKSENTILNFYAKNEPVEINLIDYEIDCVYLNGKTDFVSIFGLTGEFEGWFTNDEYAVPVLAEMKVIIGNITLELIDWKIEGWTPPKYIK